MEKTLHQVLSPKDQEELDKEKILEVLTEHNLGENINLIYKIMMECRNGRHIDDIVKKIVEDFDEEHNEGKKEDELVIYYRDLLKINEENIH